MIFKQNNNNNSNSNPLDELSKMLSSLNIEDKPQNPKKME